MARENREVKIIKPTVASELNNSKLRVAAYCRVSTNSEDQNNSFLAQLKYYNDYARLHPEIELVDIYADEGITGTCISKREEFRRMMLDASIGKLDRVFTKSVSRFARNSLECLEAIRKLKDYGVTVLFENDNIDTKTMNSELILYVKSAFAQSEALAGSKRVSTAIRMKMENGDFTTYAAPYGYKLENLNLVIVPEEAEIVKKIFCMYLSGMGTNRIAAKLNEESLLCNSKKWTVTGVRYILSNEKYIGDSMLQKTYTPQMFPLRNRPNNGELDKYYVRNTQDAIIDEDTFNAAQLRLANNNIPKPKEHVDSIFKGIIKCNECGWAYRRKIQNGIVYWVCSHKNTAGFNCGGPNISEAILKKAFVEAYNKLRQFEKEILDELLLRLEVIRSLIAGNNNLIKQIDTDIARLCEQNAMYTELHEKHIMDDVSYSEKSSAIKKKLNDLRSNRLAEINKNDNNHTFENLRFLKAQLEELPKAIIGFDCNIFSMLIDEVRICEDRTAVFITKGGLHLKQLFSEV